MFCRQPSLDVDVGGADQRLQGCVVRKIARPCLHVTHEAPRTLQEPGGILQRCAMEESDVDVRGEDIDVAERGIRHAGRGMAIVQKLGDVGTAAAHLLEPHAGDGAQLRASRFNPLVYLLLAPDRAIETKKAGHEGAPIPIGSARPTPVSVIEMRLHGLARQFERLLPLVADQLGVTAGFSAAASRGQSTGTEREKQRQGQCQFHERLLWMVRALND